MRGLLQFQLHFDALLRENEGEQSKEKLKQIMIIIIINSSKCQCSISRYKSRQVINVK